MPPFKYPPEIIKDLRDAWNQPTQSRSDPDVASLPADETLRQLLETCFHASFTSDERRATTFSVVLCTPTDAELPLHLSSPVAFNVPEITRLAPAGDLEDAMLGVDAAEGGELRIWGFTTTGWRAGGLLTISVPAAGVVRVRRRALTIFHLQGGRAEASWQAPVTYSTIAEMFPNAVDAVLATVDGARGNAWDWRRMYSDPLLELLERVAGHGHGGTVFVVPDEHASNRPWRDYIRIKYPCDDSSAWTELLASIRNFDSSTQFGETDLGRSDGARQILNGKLDHAARLTRVDGALIITDRFRLLGFGAEVVAPANVDRIWVNDREESIDGYGTRHRSAFRFCAACPEAVAFICSQDGGIKSARWVGDRVVLRR